MSLRWLLMVCCVLPPLGCSGSQQSTTPRVLIVGLDGIRSDALVAAATPAIDALAEVGTSSLDAFAGGGLGEANMQNTLSGPGWSSILTGVWIDKHGVEFNTFDGARFEDYPHFFVRAREARDDLILSSFVTWSPINDEILPAGAADEAFSPTDECSSQEPDCSARKDVLVTAAVVAHIEDEDPDVIFVQLDNPDAQGHRNAFSPDDAAYVAGIELADTQVSEMIAAIQARPSFGRESWLVIVVTDHGGVGNLHGGDSAEERTIPMIAARLGEDAPAEVSPGPGHVAVPPTVLDHLGIPVDDAWGWEAASFRPR